MLLQRNWERSCCISCHVTIAEINKKTVIEYKPDSNQAQEYRNLAEAVINNTKFDIPTPMTQERLEEILLEFGLMDFADDYHI